MRGRTTCCRCRIAGLRQHFISLALFVVLAIAHTWPLATAPSTLSRNDNADAVLNEWIVAWVAHQAPRSPRHLFDANIFYPEANTLAYSEPLVVPALTAAPLFRLGASPVLVYNLLLLAGFAITGWTASYVVARWTGDVAAGFLSGVIVAFNAHTLTRLPHLQAVHLEFLLLALLAFDAVLANHGPLRRTFGAAALLALWIVLQGWTSFYALMLTIVALAAALLVRPGDWLGARSRRVLPFVALSAAVAAAGLLPLLLHYRAVGQVRPLEEVARYSAVWRDYLSTPARVHYDTWSANLFSTTGLFPGVTAVALSLVAIGAGRLKDRRARMALAFGIAGFALSFGPALPFYELLYRWLPPLQGIRNAARFGFLLTIGLGVLAGFGLASIRARWPRAGWLPAVTIAIVVVANLDAWSAPIEYVPAEPIPALNARIAATDAIVAYIPFYPPDRVFRNAPYLLESTAHWRPMLNGYSGITPDSYVRHAAALARFPDASALAALKAAGVTHVFVHDRALRDWTDNETADAVRRSPGLRLLGSSGDLSLYALVSTTDGS